MIPPLPPLEPPLPPELVLGVDGAGDDWVGVAAAGTEPIEGRAGADRVTVDSIDAAGEESFLIVGAVDSPPDPAPATAKDPPNTAAAITAMRTPRFAVTGTSCAACSTPGAGSDRFA
jgi:hypothetical protein